MWYIYSCPWAVLGIAAHLLCKRMGRSAILDRPAVLSNPGQPLHPHDRSLKKKIGYYSTLESVWNLTT